MRPRRGRGGVMRACSAGTAVEPRMSSGAHVAKLRGGERALTTCPPPDTAWLTCDSDSDGHLSATPQNSQGPLNTIFRRNAVLSSGACTCVMRCAVMHTHRNTLSHLTSTVKQGKAARAHLRSGGHTVATAISSARRVHSTLHRPPCHAPVHPNWHRVTTKDMNWSCAVAAVLTAAYSQSSLLKHRGATVHACSRAPAVRNSCTPFSIAMVGSARSSAQKSRTRPDPSAGTASRPGVSGATRYLARARSLSAWCLHHQLPCKACASATDVPIPHMSWRSKDCASQQVALLQKTAGGKYTASDAARQAAARQHSARACGKRKRGRNQPPTRHDRTQHDRTAPMRARLCLHTSQCVARCAPPGPWRCADCHWYRHSRWMCAEEPRHAHGDSSAPPGLVSSATSQHILPRRALVGQATRSGRACAPWCHNPTRPPATLPGGRPQIDRTPYSSSAASTGVGRSDNYARAATRGAYV